MARIVDVFIASPSDVQAERLHVEQVIQLVSVRTRDLLDIVLHTVSWNNFIPSVTRCSTQKVQDPLTARVRKCGVFIGILYQRYGTQIDEERQISGTEEEFNTAIEMRNTIEILTYFRRFPTTVPSDSGFVSQFAKLQDLQDRLKNAGLLYNPYEEPTEFRERFIIDLFETVVRIRTETERRDQLRSFFHFGVNIRRESPSVLLGYPPIHKHIQPSTNDKNQKKRIPQTRVYNWQERFWTAPL